MKKFEDLVVVELASVLAGPQVGTFFSELGSRVIKIENKKTGGDVTRSWKTEDENLSNSYSAYYAAANGIKETYLLDITEKNDFLQLNDFLRIADIVIVNFKHGDAEKLNLTFDDIKAANSSIIYAELNGFGSNNNRVAYDLVLQAETGYMSINGEPSSQPLKLPVAFIDLFAAHQLKEGILVAMLKQVQHLKPYKVSVSLYDSAIASLVNQASNYLNTGTVPEQMGSLHPNIAPYGELFTSKDNVVFVLAIGTQKQFLDLLDLCNLTDLYEDERFKNNKARVKNRYLLQTELQNHLQKENFKFWELKFTAHFIPYGKIKTIKEVLVDPQSKHLLTQNTLKFESYLRVKSNVFEITC